MNSKFVRFFTVIFLAFSCSLLFVLFGDGSHDAWLPAYARTNDNTETAWSKSFTDVQGDAGPDLVSGEAASTLKGNGTATREVDLAQELPLLTDNLLDVYNDTLGAQEVFMVSLPSRRDKHDAFSVQALVTNITYTVVEGVDGESVPKKALPYTMNLKPVEIGCWRAHLNIFESILDRKIATAVIFEDDADWDVTFRDQLLQFAKGTRYVTGTEAKGSFVPHSPYGEDWDVLWIGHCNSRPTNGDNKRYVLEHDPTVVPVSARQGWERPITRYWDKEGSDFKTRVVFRTSDSSCTAAYVVSLKGAQKALYYLSMNPSDQPIDNGLGRMCGDRNKAFRCMSSFPTLVGVSKPAGSSNRGSDVDHTPSDELVHENARSERLIYSTRMNLQNLLIGQQMMFSAFPDHSPNANLGDIHIPAGSGFEFSEDDLDTMAAEDAAERELEESIELQAQALKLEEEKQKLASEEQELRNEAEQDRVNLATEAQELQGNMGKSYGTKADKGNASVAVLAARDPKPGVESATWSGQDDTP